MWRTNFTPAGLRGRVIFGKGNRMDNNELSTNLAEVGTDLARTVKGFPIDADLLMLKVEEEYGFRARDTLYELIRNMPKYDLPSVQPETAKRIVGKSRDGMTLWYQCDMCNDPVDVQDNYCRGCGRRLIDERSNRQTGGD